MLLGLAVFQIALVAGAPIGRFAWGGQQDVLPRGLRIGSLAAVALYALFALVILGRAGLFRSLPEAVVNVGIWVIAAYMVVGVGMNAISRSRSERLTMTPVAAVLAALTLAVALLPAGG